MLRRQRSIRVFVRNKARYNPESKERNFLFVDIADFAGTTVGDVKEDVRKQTKNTVRIDELFLDNQSLADDRSIAHYNLEDGTILETTSNPFWVACLYIKAAEIQQEQQGNPTDNEVQKWTQKSLPKKYTLIGLLLNSKNEYVRQPPHFPTLDDFVDYLERLNKKGATMHPNYTQKDLRALEREYQDEYEGRHTDPLAVFIDHYAVRLGYLDPETVGQGGPGPGNAQHKHRGGADKQNQIRRPAGHRNQERLCEDCEEAPAQVYCSDCPGGLALCRRCSGTLHAGATRRRHNLQDIQQAPKNNKPYVPRAFLAPFSIMVALYSALQKGHLSLTEDEIKMTAQPLTDTDLQDKQLGKYVGGFDCMENVLMARGFVKKEAARVPTYALTEKGHTLGERLYLFYNTCYSFLQSARLPRINIARLPTVVEDRKICLLVDENERDKDRLLRYCAEKGIDAQVRLLPAGDYIWILTPPLVDPTAPYIGRDPNNEQVLPFVVERKSWEDFENSINSPRYQRQINNMLGSGLRHCFYLMEGSPCASRHNPNHQHQIYLKGMLERLTVDYGFYVNYTSSWMKSAQWLLWFTSLVTEAHTAGHLRNQCIQYGVYTSRVARQNGLALNGEEMDRSVRHTHKWMAQLFIDHIFHDSQSLRPMLKAVTDDLGVSENGNKHLLVVEGLEQYNKLGSVCGTFVGPVISVGRIIELSRQSTLTRCCEAVHARPDRAKEIVQDQLGAMVLNMVHYDISSYWQLYIQLMVHVYVVRTETGADTDRVQRRFLNGPQIPPQDGSPNVLTRTKKSPGRVKGGFPASTHEHFKREQSFQKNISTSIEVTTNARTKTPSQCRKKQKIHTIGSSESSFLEDVASTSTNSWTDSNIEVDQNIMVANAGHSKDTLHSMSNANQIIEPFCGEGHRLGNEATTLERNNLETFDMPEEKLGNLSEEQQIERAIRMSMISASPSGKRKRSVEVVRVVGNGHCNESGKEVIHGARNDQYDESGKDITQLTEQEQFEMAIKLSKERNSRDHHQEQVEVQQMKLALERSITEQCPAKVYGRETDTVLVKAAQVDECTMSEEEQLKLALKMSETESKALEDKPQDINEESLVEFVLQRSKIEHSLVKGARMVDSNHNVKIHSKPVNDLIDLTEEEQLKMAIALSEMETDPVLNVCGKTDACKSQQMDFDSKPYNFKSHLTGTKQCSAGPVNEGNVFGKAPAHDELNENEIIYINSQSQSQDDSLADDIGSIDCESDGKCTDHIEDLSEKQVRLNKNEYQKHSSSDVNVTDKESIKHCSVSQLVVNSDDTAVELQSKHKLTLTNDSGDDSEEDEEIVGPSPQKDFGNILRLSQGQKSSSRLELDRNSELSRSGLKHSSIKSQISNRSILPDISPNITRGCQKGFDFKSSLLLCYDDSDKSESDLEEKYETNALQQSKTSCVMGKCSNSRQCLDGKGNPDKHNCDEASSDIVNTKTDMPQGFSNVDDKRMKQDDMTDLQSSKDVSDNIQHNDTETAEDTYDENDNDIDFLSSQMDQEEAISSDSEEADDDEVMKELNDLHSPECFDRDSLPVIRRPVSKRYRKLKHEVEVRCKQIKRERSDEGSGTNIGIVDKDGSNKSVVLDSLLAHMLQEEFDKESRKKMNTGNEIDDEYVARQLDAQWNEGISSLSPGGSSSDKTVNHLSREATPRQSNFVSKETDEEVARRLHAELNATVVDSTLDASISANNTVNNSPSTAKDNPQSNDKHKEDEYLDDDVAQLRMLIEREKEQMERWQQIMQEDEKLARRLQTMDNQNEGDDDEIQLVSASEPCPRHSGPSLNTHSGPGLNTMREPSFRSVVAQHKASREKAVAQMAEYRRLQTERYKGHQSLGSIPHSTGTDASMPPPRKEFEVSKPSQSVSHIDPEQAQHIHGSARDVGAAKGNPPVQSQHTVYSNTSQPPWIDGFKPQMNQLQGIDLGKLSQDSQSDMDLSGQSQSGIVGHMLSASQSQTPKSCFVTCGNCGEKGHNRTWARCPKYHTADESARREAKLEKQRAQKEERRRQEMETVKMLTEHQKELEAMTTQIQAEMADIQTRIRQRTSQLESQVSNRMKRMEKVTKRKTNK